MKKVIALTVVVVLALAMFAGCTNAPKATTAPATDAPASAAPVESAAVPAPGSAKVEIAGNATTGYAWTCALAAEGIVTVAEPEYVPDENKDNAEGVGGKYIFTFTAVAPGEVVATFSNAPVAEPTKVEGTLTYKVVVAADLTVTATEELIGENTTNPLMCTVALPANASTGYTWTYTFSTEGIVTETRNEYLPTSEESATTPGAPGEQVVDFTGAKEGETLVTFNYAPASDPTKIEETHVYKIVVDKDLLVTMTEELPAK